MSCNSNDSSVATICHHSLWIMSLGLPFSGIKLCLHEHEVSSFRFHRLRTNHFWSVRSHACADRIDILVLYHRCGLRDKQLRVTRLRRTEPLCAFGSCVGFHSLVLQSQLRPRRTSSRFTSGGSIDQRQGFPKMALDGFATIITQQQLEQKITTDRTATAVRSQS